MLPGDRAFQCGLFNVEQVDSDTLTPPELPPQAVGKLKSEALLIIDMVFAEDIYNI